MLFTSCVPISCVGVSSVQGYLHLLLGDPLGPSVVAHQRQDR